MYIAIHQADSYLTDDITGKPVNNEANLPCTRV